VLAEVETDKATMELESYQSGTLLYIGVEKGKAVKIDGILAVIGKEGEDYKHLLEENAETAAPAKEATPKKLETKSESKSDASSSTQTVSLPAGAKEIRMPLLSDTMTEGKIVAWHKKVGD